MPTCIRCGKKLTDPDSIERGMGPICWGGTFVRDPKTEDSDKMIFIPEPLQNGIILERQEGKVATNVPWLVVSGSPDGYEWGYGGSGPADLALNILENVMRIMQFRGHRSKAFRGTCYDLAFSSRTEFKNKYIATIPRDGGIIPWENVKKWVLSLIVENQRKEGL